jgi:hypothetical protein
VDMSMAQQSISLKSDFTNLLVTTTLSRTPHVFSNMSHGPADGCSTRAAVLESIHTTTIILAIVATGSLCVNAALRRLQVIFGLIAIFRPISGFSANCS